MFCFLHPCLLYRDSHISNFYCFKVIIIQSKYILLEINFTSKIYKLKIFTKYLCTQPCYKRKIMV